MGLSLDGEQGLSMRSVRAALLVFATFFAFAVYFYGPPVTPALRAAATAECNEHAGGNFRDYRLSWISGPTLEPHWSCWDAGDPDDAAVSLGWWVDPFS